MKVKAMHLKAGDTLAALGRIHAVHNNGEVVLLANGEWREFHSCDTLEVQGRTVEVRELTPGQRIKIGSRAIDVKQVFGPDGAGYYLVAGYRGDDPCTPDWARLPGLSRIAVEFCER